MRKKLCVLIQSGPVARLPAKSNGYPTFGSFNNLIKINDDVLDLWRELLEKLEESRLVIQTLRLSEQDIEMWVFEHFGRYGISSERIKVYGSLPFKKHLELYGEVDITLDTFPWNGHMTTLNSLWMGVPVLTLIGDSRPARMGLSLLSSIGLDEFAVKTKSEFIEKVLKLNADFDLLDQIRQGMRERMRLSPLMDCAQYVAKLEAEYERMIEVKKLRN